MGGAALGLPLDGATTISNPAGLTELNKRLDLSLTYFRPEVWYRASSQAGYVANDGAKIDSDCEGCLIPGVGLVQPPDNGWTCGLGVYGTTGMGVDYPSNLYFNVTYTEYQFLKVAPALAYQVNEKLSIGAALNVDYATMAFHAGSLAEVPHNDSDALGIGATAGFLYRLSDATSVGLTYMSKQAFENFVFRTSAGTDEVSLDQPQTLTLGFGVRPTDRLRFAFDVAWIDWPQTAGENMPVYTTNSSGATLWNMNWDEQFVYKFGLEYDFSDKWTVRAGYNYGAHPLDTRRAFENIAFPAVIEHHVTAGLSVKLKKNMVFDLGGMYAPEATVRTANASQFINSARTGMSEYSIDTGLSWQF